MADLEDRLQTLLQYAPDVSLRAALDFLRGQEKTECRCDSMHFRKGHCPAHPWRGCECEDALR